MDGQARSGGVKWRKLAINMMVGAVAGAAGASVVMHTAAAGMLGALSTSQTIALLVALIYLLMGVGVGLGLLMPRVGSEFLNVEDSQEIDEQRALLTPSAISCLAMAFGLGTIAIAGGSAEAAGSAIVSPPVALGVFLVTLAIATWLSLASMRHADEMMRQTMHESAAAGFYLSFAVIGGWALLAHLTLVEGPRMLDIVTLFYALALVGCYWVIGRRGLLVR